VIVDDGSKEPIVDWFADETVHLVTHQKNEGKGAAIKTGLTYIKNNLRQIQVVVTADADGQHDPEDILKVATKACNLEESTLVLGVRDFRRANVPLKSRLGNTVMSKFVSPVIGAKLSDTQTGLRGFSVDHIDWLKKVRGKRFDYEINYLLASRKMGLRIVQVPIQTKYIDGNTGSSFKPIRDSINVLLSFFLFSFSSALSAILDLSMFALLYHVISQNMGVVEGTLVAIVLARIISAALNFFINWKFVFRFTGSKIKASLRYLATALLLLSLSLIGTPIVSTYFGMNVVLAKALVDTMTFVIAFFVQRLWVFSAKFK
jgi:glycosyltransferase involved in cell wall biosynthesis